MIQDLVDVQLGNTSELSSSDLDTVMGKLNEVVDIGAIKPPLAGNIVDIVADIILSDTDVTPVANTLLNMTSAVGDTMDFQGQSVTLTAPSLALSVSNVDSQQFSGLTFGVFASDPLPDTDATISLPSELNNFFTPGERNTTRVQFQFYGTQELFQEPPTVNATEGNWTLNSYIVSASINNSHVSNLKDQVVVNFRHQQPKKPDNKVQCVFWDFQKNGGQGGWNSRGCKSTGSSANQTRCLCDHLTHFAVLLDVSRSGAGDTDTYILTVISYVGCGISSIFLGITLLTYVAFEKLRQDHPSKILINLSSALLGSTMLFLLNPWLSSFSNYGLCIATAAALHYFLLASFTWMGLEAVHMYLALVKVFNIYIPSYILKFCAVGWGNVIYWMTNCLFLSLFPSCWLHDDVFFYTTWVAFALLILLCNLSVFVVVLIQIKHMQVNKTSTSSRSILSDVRAVASLTVLLGLTWSMGFFSFGPGKVVMMYLFCIFNTMQGFCVFFFHCLMKENVRKQWRIHLCCGRFRLSDYSGTYPFNPHNFTVSSGHQRKYNLMEKQTVTIFS
uniref:Adhesion G protein-coupled receptor G4b n=1 Tax=Sphaeramia orbicularis TaxID=375764 RepID=A0A672YPL4_9TELE